MARIISVFSSKTPSVVVIQRAYEEFFGGPTPHQAEYRNDTGAEALAFMVTAGSQIAWPTTPPAEDWLKFQRLVAQWDLERGAMSSTTEAATRPAYLSIIGMGPVAVPLLLKQLESEGDEPDQWFVALTSITGAAPENPGDQGNYIKMAASWFEWAKKNGYAW